MGARGELVHAGQTGEPGGAMRLVTLGRLALLRPSGEDQPLRGHRRELVLLAVLALSPEPVSRDVLVEMLWAVDGEPGSRRHLLRSALSFLRGILGRESITLNRARVELAPLTVATDLGDLLVASRAREFNKVLKLATGPFLSDVLISGSATFETWKTARNAEFLRAAVSAAEALCTVAAAQRDWTACNTAAQRWLEFAPTSSDALLHLMNSARARGTPQGRLSALAAYDQFTIAALNESAPDARVVELARRLQLHFVADMAEGRRAPEDSLVQDHEPIKECGINGPDYLRIDTGTPVSADAQPCDDIRSERTFPMRYLRGRPRAKRLTVASAALLMFVVAVAAIVVTYGMSRRTAQMVSRPVVAITSIVDRRNDSASTWLEDGLPQMMTADMSRSRDIDPVGPVLVRAARVQLKLGSHGALRVLDESRLGREVGATITVSGGFSRVDGLYIMDLTARSAATGRLLGKIAVRGSDPMTVAASASDRLLAVAGSTQPGAYLADVETSNVAARQHFLRGIAEQNEGRISDARRELDAAIRLDPGFATALAARAHLAQVDGDDATLGRTRQLMRHARRTRWDVLADAIETARHNGETGRTLQLANDLARDYPRDPRAYAIVASSYMQQGDWQAAEAAAKLELALDSLGVEAADGPCVPCTAYHTLLEVQFMRGDAMAAERIARKWLTLQPDLPAAWGNLADALDYTGRVDAALDAYRRASMLSGNEPKYRLRTARALVAADRFEAADAILSSLDAASDKDVAAGVVDLRVLEMREQGEYSRSNNLIETYLSSGQHDGALLLEQMDALGRMGDYSAVVRLFRARIANETTPTEGIASPALLGDKAREFCWTRALEANSLAGSGDTLQLRALVDSIRIVSAGSYFERDRRLYHHVLGLVAMRGRRYAEAEREFQAARWGAAGWTETNAWLARAQLAQHEPRAAIMTLRAAFQGPLDAMSRYEPHSELDALMASAFSQANESDSAAVYAHAASRARSRIPAPNRSYAISRTTTG